jgi:D-lyxose ketol-isomerase
MKRSQINAALRWAKQLLEKQNFKLPMFGYWDLAQWREHKDKTATIQKTMLGWDVTDFDQGDFEALGNILFTVRNGVVNMPGVGTPYAEKLIMIMDGQRLPNHFHNTKSEDIINRGGGMMYMRLYNAHDDDTVDFESDVTVKMDGVTHTVKAGETLEILPGNSITITPRLYHLFGAKAGCGDLLVGEVSSINDDNTDNYFAEKINRFSQVEEDEPILHPLCNEYSKVL